MTDTLTQNAPWPADLEDLVARLTYRRGWTFTLDPDLDRGQGSRGATLIIRVDCDDAYHHTRQRSVLHYMPVPPAAYHRDDWQRWLLDQVLAVEQHEACEFFTVDGTKPYAPRHGDGRNPYVIVEYATNDDRHARPGGAR